MASNSVWEPCKPYVSLFEKYANLHNIPPILVSSTTSRLSSFIFVLKSRIPPPN